MPDERCARPARSLPYTQSPRPAPSQDCQDCLAYFLERRLNSAERTQQVLSVYKIQALRNVSLNEKNENTCRSTRRYAASPVAVL